VAIGVERFGPADPTRGVSVGVQNDLGIDEVPGGDSLVQSLAKSSSSRHVRKRVEGAPSVVGRIYSIRMVWQIHPFPVKPTE